MNILRSSHAFFTNAPALFLLVFAFSVHGQGQDITQADFEKMESIGHAGLKGKAYRDTSMVEQFVGGAVQKEKTKREITEFLPPNRSRHVSNSVVDGKEVSREVIGDGSSVWVRVNNGQWEQNPEPMATSMGYLGRAISRSHRIVGTSRSSGSSLTLYEQVIRLSTKAGGDTWKEEIATLRYWVDKDGLFLQKEYETFDVSSNTVNRRYTFYEYDPKDLKIETPIK